MEILLFVSIGLTVGAVSGILGIGGGVLLVPALMWLCGFDPKKATGTSLAILVPPIGLPAALQAYRRGEVELDAALWVAAAFVVGAYASRALIDFVPEQTFRMLFGMLMIYIAFRFMLSSSSEAVVAVSGLFAVGVALVSFVLLRSLGRRCLPPPSLGEEITRMYEEGRGDPEYYI